MEHFTQSFIHFIDTFNPWIVLVIAICCSTFGTTCLKLSDGLTKIIPIIGVIIGYSCFFVLITIIFKNIDLSIGYAIWSGLSTTMVCLVGILIFKEPITLKKAVGLFLIILGVIGLSLTS